MAERIVVAQLDIDTRALEERLLETTQEINRLNQAQRALRTSGEQASRTYAENTERIRQLRREARGYQTTLDRLNEATLEAEEANRLYTRALSQEARSIQALREQNRQLTQIRNRTNIETNEGRQAVERLNAQITRNNEVIRRNQDELTQQRLNIGNYGSALTGAGRVLTRFTSFISAAGVGVVSFGAILANAGRRVVDFNTEITRLRSILGLTVAESRLLSAAIIEIAARSTRTATEIASLATSLAALGRSQGEILNLLEPITNLSIALDAASDSAGELLINTLNAFGESSSEAQRYADIIARVRTSTSLDFERIRVSLGFLSSSARSAGLTLEETAAILGVLADNGIRAESAGRLTSTVLLRLAARGQTLNEAFDQLNRTQERTTNNTVILAEAARLFGAEGARVGIILANNRDRAAELADQFRNASGALDGLVSTQLESLEARTNILNSAWERLILTIEDGDSATGRFIRNTIDGLTDIIGLITQAVQSQDQLNRSIAADQGARTQEGLNNLVRERINLLQQERREQGETLLRGEELAMVQAQIGVEVAQNAAEEQQALADQTQAIIDDITEEIDALRDRAGDRAVLLNIDDEAILRVRELEVSLDEQIETLATYEGRADAALALFAEFTAELGRLEDATGGVEAASDVVADSALEAINALLEGTRVASDALAQLRADSEGVSPALIREVETQLDEDFFASVDEAERQRLADLDNRLLQQEQMLIESGASQLEIETQQAINRAAVQLEMENLTARQRVEIQERLAMELNNINLRQLENERQNLQARIGLARGAANLLTSIFGQTKGAAIANILIERASSISEIVSNTGIANAKAIAASPLTAGQPFVGINTAAAALNVAASVNGAVRAISEINSTRAPVPTFREGGILTFREGGTIRSNREVRHTKEIRGKGTTIVNGRSHEQGGVPIFAGDQLIGEMEGGEIIGIFNRGASADIMAKNQEFATFTGEQVTASATTAAIPKFQQGGLISPRIPNVTASQVQAIINSQLSRTIVAVPVPDINDVNADITATAIDGTI